MQQFMSVVLFVRDKICFLFTHFEIENVSYIVNVCTWYNSKLQYNDHLATKCNPYLRSLN